MAMQTHFRPLAAGYSTNDAAIPESDWNAILETFDDANIYQTWAYGEVVGRGRCHRFVLRRHGRVMGAAQARIARVPGFGSGIAYVRWGPLWRRRGEPHDREVLRQAIRAMRNEYVCRCGLSLRVFPVALGASSPETAALLAQEGLEPINETPGRTILLDLTPSLDELRRSMARNWRRNLKAAEKNDFEIVEGTSGELFENFIAIYRELVARKGFAPPNDIDGYLRIQDRLPVGQKMGVALCRSRSGVSAGLVWSALGGTGIELFAATSDAGGRDRGSYLLRWRLVQTLKAAGLTQYNLNGINPVVNPGGYKFKSELAGCHGHDVSYLGRFDAYPGRLARVWVNAADRLRRQARSVRGFLAAPRRRATALDQTDLARHRAGDSPFRPA